MDNPNPEPYESYSTTDVEYVLLVLTTFIFGTLLFAVLKAAGHSLKRFRSYYEESEISESRTTSLALRISNNYKVYSYAEHIASTVIYTFLVFLFTLLLNHFRLLSNGSFAIIVVLFISIIVFGAGSYILGVVIPRNIASKHIIGTAKFSAPFMQFFYFIFYPFVILVKIFDLRLRSKSVKNYSDDNSTGEGTEEIRYLIDESSKSGILNLEDQELIENVIDFTETTVRQVMVPRNKISALEKNADIQTIRTKILQEGYSRMPVYESSLDNITGIINTRDVLISMLNNDFNGLEHFTRDTVFVKEGENIDSLLKTMQNKKLQMSIVLDDFGGTAGIVTMEDILEELVGEIQDEHDEEQRWIEFSDDGSYIIKAFSNINKLNELLPYPLPESKDYETLGGLIMTETGTIPEANESYELYGYRMVILNRTSRHIDTVKLLLLAEKS